MAAVEASGLAPLDYLLAVMRDESNPTQVRLDAAKAAAPYVHPRLAAIEHRGKGGTPTDTITRVIVIPAKEIPCATPLMLRSKAATQEQEH